MFMRTDKHRELIDAVQNQIPTWGKKPKSIPIQGFCSGSIAKGNSSGFIQGLDGSRKEKEDSKLPANRILKDFI